MSIQDRKNIREFVKQSTGLRNSPRLMACVDIVWFFRPLGRFGRLEVLGDRSGLTRTHHPKTLSRALQDLESAGVIETIERRAHQGGGAVFGFVSLPVVTP